MLTVKHSPSFTFYEPHIDTCIAALIRDNSPFLRYSGKRDAAIWTLMIMRLSISITTDNPATINYESHPDSLLLDGDTRLLVKGLQEDAEGASDMYVWDVRNPPNDVPQSGARSAIRCDQRRERHSTTALPAR